MTPLRIHQALNIGRRYLEKGFSGANPYTYGVFQIHDLNPGLESRVLLALALNISPDYLWSRLQDPLEFSSFRCYRELLRKRIAGEPIAYLRGSQEFFGLDYYVAPGVLIPREETEVLVSWVLEDYPEDFYTSEGVQPRLHDCCTGTGCIPWTIKYHRNTWLVSASDIDDTAVETAETNRRNLGVDGRVYKADLLNGLPSGPGVHRFDIITANPPYLTQQEWSACMDAGWKEPELALSAGDDGLLCIRLLIAQARDWLKPSGRLYIESGPSQCKAVAELLQSAGFSDIKIRNDLSDRERITRGTR